MSREREREEERERERESWFTASSCSCNLSPEYECHGNKCCGPASILFCVYLTLLSRFSSHSPTLRYLPYLRTTLPAYPPYPANPEQGDNLRNLSICLRAFLSTASP